MIAFLLWYACITLVGWVAFPLAFRLLPALKDRGYTLSRALGWLLWGYAFWIMASLGIAQNDLGGIGLAFFLLILASLLALRDGGLQTIRAWVGEQRRMIIVSEIVFLVAFAAWVFVRANNPEIVGTEKPMEMAFINSILKSPSFPPNDPWLSGYAISYYYFGYILVSMLIRATGVITGVGFNLAVALIFGLVALGAYGLIYNLLQLLRKPGEEGESGKWLALPALGPLFILIVSNFEGFLEVLHARGIFWTQDASGQWTSGFWSWLGIQELVNPPDLPLSWMPSRPNGVVWWRASRVLTDYGLDGSQKEVIDEFPFFSYLLSDLHPHVLSMPFVLLAISLALHAFLDRRRERLRVFGIELPFGPGTFGLAAIILGGLGFLNTWDFPIYVALFSAALTLVRVFEEGWRINRLWEFIGVGLAVGISGFLLYLPFYIGFSSQAGGILPSMAFFTRGAHLWVMFGPLLIPVFGFLIYLWRRPESRPDILRGLGYAASLLVSLFLLMYLLADVISFISYKGANTLFLNNQGVLEQGLRFLFEKTAENRLNAPGAGITLFMLAALLFGLLAAEKFRRKPKPLEEDRTGVESEPPLLAREPSFGFILVVIGLGVLLILIPEFFYLRDDFGSRMNTIFKFYFQAWNLLGIAAAFVSAAALLRLNGIPRLAFNLVWIVVAGMALAYPVTMLWVKTNGFHPMDGLTLDGTAQIAKYNPDEQKAIDWLRLEPVGVLAEAVGGQYSAYARIAANTGQPNVLGWPGHEGQWGRGEKEMGSRQEDIVQLYQTSDWTIAQKILQKYQIRYVYVGDLEDSTYRVNRFKFDQNLVPAFQSGLVTIYTVPDFVLNASAIAQK
ncbi:MAG TPA: DUF2298 domain-containing protein [Anaerolineaceae bacterium]|nr:DUF2298 domain-containing protein [Anaerolineaceae bacterium]